MEQAVRRFARNILLIHLALLGLVLATVLFASRAIEQSARDQALDQAERRQALLTSQTARGIEHYYQAILSDMDLLPRDAADQLLLDLKSTPVRARPRRGGGAGGGNAPARGPGPRAGALVGQLLSRQLEERASHVFVIDRRTLTVRENILEPAEGEGPSARQVVDTFGPWLRQLTEQSVSPFRLVGDTGLNLVCLPIARNQRVVVAAVPIRQVQLEYLGRLNVDEHTAAWLFDESLTIMAASRPVLVGGNLNQLDDPQVKATLAAYQSDGFRGSRVMPAAFRIGPETFDPAVTSAEPIEIVPGKRWFVLISSPLAEVDQVVSALFDKVFWWAAFVTVAITAILVSTAGQMIRSRMRLESLRREVLERDLQQARQIQLAWLPQEGLCRPRIDIAAVNQPASHISGDFYNWFDLPDGRTAVVIGDVTGHGMSAAFLMATSQLLVRNTLSCIPDPGRCLEEVNRQLCVQVFNGQFVTMQILVFDLETGQVELATGGHPPPLVAENGDGLRPLPVEPQLMLGVEPDTTYPTERYDLPSGAHLLLYTDGVTDLQDPDGARLHGEGLLERAQGHHGTARDLLNTVLTGLSRFRGSRELGDDLTIVAIRLERQSAAQPLLATTR